MWWQFKSREFFFQLLQFTVASTVSIDAAGSMRSHQFFVRESKTFQDIPLLTKEVFLMIAVSKKP